MQTHPQRGLEIIDYMLREFGHSQLSHVEILRNIVYHHHEAVDGSGYPAGLADDDIPIEARIVSVADIFDALTSERPYKRAWSNDQAFEAMRALAGSKLDEDCVDTLVRYRGDVERIQSQFQETRIG